jgi:hypothetical protein
MKSSPQQLGAGGRFELLGKLGEGGMGAVYEALDRERGERLALKVVVGADATGLQRFKHEFRALQDLEHPNLVRLGELHEADGEWFITMELVPGTDLLSHVCESGQAYDETRLRACFQQLAVGLRALHVAGKVHRDIKPSNVRVTPEGRVVILDFGLVIDRTAARMSTEGNVVGTAAYMAPEQASGAPIEAAADWYAFGVVLYEALTGTVPFTGSNLQVLMDKLRITPPPPRARVASVPPDLDELCVELLHFDPARRPHGDEVLRRLGVAQTKQASSVSRTTSLQSDLGTFVGRGAEFDQLEAAFAQVQAGRTLTVSVEGPSGIGKSALVTHFTQQLPLGAANVMILHGRCYERETARFKALDGLVDALATQLTRLPKTDRHELLPRNAALLKQLFPVLGRVDAIARAPRPAVTPRDAVEERRWMFASLRELLVKLGDRRPVVLVIDDMHWADGDSLELLRVLLDAGHEPPPRLLLLVTSRVPWLGVGGHGAPEPWPVELRTVPLTPLPAEDATWLARALLERHGKSALDVQVLVREAGGHPLFVAELVRHAAPHPDNSAPLTLDRAIWDRARALPEPALRVLRVLAVAALPLPVHILELATNLAPSVLERQLGILRLEAFVRSATGRDKRLIEPYHDRVREAVRDQLDPEQRKELHATLAALLEQEPGVDLEHVAQHHLDAGDRDKACLLFERAARAAEEGFAFERAAQLYRLQLTLRSCLPAEQSALHRKVGSALARAGQGRAAADAYALAVEGADKLGRVHLRYLSAAHLLRSGYIAEGLAELEQVLLSVGLRAPRSRLAALATFVWERARRRLSGYRFTFRDPAAVPPQLLARADALYSVAQGLAWVDGIRAAPLVAKAVRAALATGERTRLVRALMGEAMFLSMGGPRKAKTVYKLLGMMREAAAPLDTAEMRGFVALAESGAASNLGQYRTLHDKATEALALYEQSGAEVQWERASARVFRMWGQIYLGRVGQMVHEAAEATADAEARKDRWLASLLRMTSSTWGAVREQAGDHSEARSKVNEAYGPWLDREPGFMHATWVLNLLLLDLFERRGDQLLQRLAAAHPTLRRSGALRTGTLPHHFAAYAATAHLHLYLTAPAAARLQHALVCARPMRAGSTHFVGYADLVSAQVALAHGQLQRALELARSARAHFTEQGTASHQHLAMALEGKILGGDAGSALIAEAHSHFADQGIRRPEDVVRAMAPLAAR